MGISAHFVATRFGPLDRQTVVGSIAYVANSANQNR